jgi:histidine triad (HIT) family protein
MSDCILCDAINEREGLIYEDKEVFAILSNAPASAGHIILFPKKHYPIIEQIPDYEFAQLFSIANKLSIAVFERVGCSGTNIIIQNGVAAGQTVPHVSLHIIPRRENDNLNFQWAPKQLTEEEMSTVELKIKEEAAKIGAFEKEQKKEAVVIEQKKEKIVSKEENYLIKQLRRIP